MQHRFNLTQDMGTGPVTAYFRKGITFAKAYTSLACSVRIQDTHLWLVTEKTGIQFQAKKAWIQQVALG